MTSLITSMAKPMRRTPNIEIAMAIKARKTRRKRLRIQVIWWLQIIITLQHVRCSAFGLLTIEQST
jgi:hypothetical protein